MTIATAKFTDDEHARFTADINHLDWLHAVSISRDGKVTTITSNDDGAHSLKKSLEVGLLFAWGYHKKFTIVEQVA